MSTSSCEFKVTLYADIDENDVAVLFYLPPRPPCIGAEEPPAEHGLQALEQSSATSDATDCHDVTHIPSNRPAADTATVAGWTLNEDDRRHRRRLRRRIPRRRCQPCDMKVLAVFGDVDDDNDEDFYSICPPSPVIDEASTKVDDWLTGLPSQRAAFDDIVELGQPLNIVDKEFASGAGLRFRRPELSNVEMSAECYSATLSTGVQHPAPEYEEIPSHGRNDGSITPADSKRHHIWYKRSADKSSKRRQVVDTTTTSVNTSAPTPRKANYAFADYFGNFGRKLRALTTSKKAKGPRRIVDDDGSATSTISCFTPKSERRLAGVTGPQRQLLSAVVAADRFRDEIIPTSSAEGQARRRSTMRTSTSAPILRGKRNAVSAADEETTSTNLKLEDSVTRSSKWSHVLARKLGFIS